MQDREERDEEDGVAEANEAEEKRHVELQGCAFYGRVLEGDSVKTVEDGREESERVAKEELGGGFGGEWMRD